MVAGFPGVCAESVLGFAEVCCVRDLATLCARHCGLGGGDPGWTLEWQGLPVLSQAESRACSEDVDVLVVCLGANDLLHDAPWRDVVRRLHRLWRLYTARGTRVVLLSIGGAAPGVAETFPEYEKARSQTNEVVLQFADSVDCDSILAQLPPGQWREDEWHLTAKGFLAFGDILAEALVTRLPSLRLHFGTPGLGRGLAERAWAAAASRCGGGAPRFLRVSGCHIPHLANALVGVYTLQRWRYGRPLYQKAAQVEGESVVLYFYSDRHYPMWNGWWFGPKGQWDGWAWNADVTALTPPSGGWRSPPGGPDDVTLRVAPVCGRAAPPSSRAAARQPVAHRWRT